MAFYYLRTFGHSQSGQKRLRSRFIAAAIATTAMIFAAAPTYRWTMKFPHRINSHLAGFVSKCEAAPIYEELLGAASD